MIPSRLVKIENIDSLSEYLKSRKNTINNCLKKNRLKIELGIEFELCKLIKKKEFTAIIAISSSCVIVNSYMDIRYGALFSKFNFTMNDFMDLLV